MFRSAVLAIRRGRRLVGVAFYATLLLVTLVSTAVGAAQSGEKVEVLRVEGAITPIVESYIERGIQMAENERANLLVITLDTPGGSWDVTRLVTRRMTDALVPIVVYIAPSGAHAASAGTFITLAAHLAAMAPGTSVGAASPVSSGGADLGATEKEKAIAILEADIKGLAHRRGAKAEEWAGQAVREAKAATEQQALDLGVVDVVAVDLDDLLNQLDGRQVQVGQQTVTLHTHGVPRETVEMNQVERLLHIITDPNIAIILMTLGVNGLLFELSSPGSYVPGVVGGICLLLGLYALGVLQANWIGLIFIALAFVLFVLDVKTPTHGVLTAGGMASFIFGSLILFQSPYYQTSVWLIVGIALVTGAFFVFAIAKVVQAQRRRPTTGLEGLMGRTAVSRTALVPQGSVFLQGEWWEALAEDGPIDSGETVVVVGREGFVLRVRRAESVPIPSG